jgi:alkanesulfonate monooxygenase SsuD/methylene tetrahydromethanopterin reductase-like flavin-dependent oxidoreductase (luciferase family)
MTRFGLLSLADHLADPASGRRSSQAERYRLIVDAAVWAESAGFEHVGLGEHHFTDYIVPSPPLLLAAIATRTKRIRLGTAVTLLAGLDPVRVAEDLATLDVISNGRAEMTFARGVIASNAAAFGIHDETDLRPRFEENLRLVLRLLTEECVTWSGRYRAPLREVRIEPRPIQPPHHALSVGGGLSNISCDLAADLGLPLTLPSLFRYPEDFVPIVSRYRERMERNGFSERSSVSFPSYVHVARTSQEARARWRPYMERYVSFATEHRSGYGRPLDFEGLLRGPAICGSPAEVVDRIATINAVLGLSVHYLMPDLGGLPSTILQEVLELLGGEVLPHARGPHCSGPG